MWNCFEIEALRKIVGQINAFGTDNQDEFTIRREDGAVQGIFKTWAVPVIPFLDRSNIEVLVALWRPEIISLMKRMGFRSALEYMSSSGMTEDIKKNAQTALTILDSWQEMCIAYPIRLARSLERARLYSWLLDKSLITIFNKEPVAGGLDNQINVLVNRLYLAFGLMNPFYNLEAIVADPRYIYKKGAIDVSVAKGGHLDAICLLLPSIFREEIIAKPKDWNGISWQILHQQAEELKKSKVKGKILINLARLTDLPIHHILFAINALEWIPQRVGGKKDDIKVTNEIILQFSEQLSNLSSNQIDGITVLSEMNALIRFLNWVPIIEGEENFKGLNWTYSSVCDTTQLLIETVSENPTVWQAGFADVFNAQLKPQLVNLDATSAKGRFLFHLIVNERRIKNEFFRGIDEDWQMRTAVSASQPLAVNNIKNPTISMYPVSLVGDKPKGLALASLVIGKNRVLPGFSISTSMVETFLKESSAVSNLILQLEQTTEIDLKKRLGRKIRDSIIEQPLPKWMDQFICSELKHFHQIKLWAIRASSLDEKSARGVHLTVLRCPQDKLTEAVKKCIASYYSTKAIFFRLTGGISDLPWFAVLVQPYHQGKGGVTEIRHTSKDKNEIVVSIGRTADSVTSADLNFADWRVSFGDKMLPDVAATIPFLEELTKIFGSIQIEWAKDNSDNKIILFQMELLSGSITRDPSQQKKIAQRYFYLKSLKEVGALLTFMETHQDSISLTLGFNNLEKFQEELFALIARFGRRIIQIHLPQPISSSSHFANICRYFDIELN